MELVYTSLPACYRLLLLIHIVQTVIPSLINLNIILTLPFVFINYFFHISHNALSLYLIS